MSVIVEPWAGASPEAAAWHLRAVPGLVWLDSSLQGGRLGRWSIVACAPRWTLTARGRRLTRVEAGSAGAWDGDPVAALASAIEAEPVVAAPEGHADLPFVGGAIGYLGFELGRHIERLPATTVDDIGAADLAVGWYDAALLWDGEADRGVLVGTPEAVQELRAHLDGAGSLPPRRELVARTPLRSNFTRAEYLEAVRRALAYIAAGDIYQVNLSQRFSVRVHASGLDLYRRLRQISPAPFAAYLALGGVEVLSSSPERLLLADSERMETRPIKGTRPRGATPEADACLASELQASVKDHAEHVMIDELERNVLGRVAETGTVEVPELAALETYAQVHHLTSTVTAQRRADANLEAVLRAIFPGGSVTGAPKIRALQIIDELEPTVRGVYTGAIGYISAHGRIDLNVAIRTVTLLAGVAHAQVGGAIVADSDPDAEYRETLDKARGMASALGAVLPAAEAAE